jgi:hypothetical protein
MMKTADALKKAFQRCQSKEPIADKWLSLSAEKKWLTIKKDLMLDSIQFLAQTLKLNM